MGITPLEAQKAIAVCGMYYIHVAGLLKCEFLCKK